MIESFWSIMQCELLDTRAVLGEPERLGAAIFEWIEVWLTRRCHTSLGMLSPAAYEHEWHNQQSALHAAADVAAANAALSPSTRMVTVISLPDVAISGGIHVQHGPAMSSYP